MRIERILLAIGIFILLGFFVSALSISNFGNIDVVDNATIRGNLTVSENITIQALISCDSLDTDSSGLIICGVDGGGGESSWVFATDLITNDTSGVKVGIGTATPETELEVTGAINVSTYYGVIGGGKTVLSNNALTSNAVTLDARTSGITFIHAVGSTLTISNGSELYRFTDTSFHPREIASLGLSTQRWNQTFGIDGFFSGNLGVGTDTPLGTLHIQRAGALNPTVVGTGDDLVIESSAHVGISILSDETLTSNILFGDQNSGDQGEIEYDNVFDRFEFYTDSTLAMVISALQRVGIGTSSPSHALQVRVNNGANADQTAFFQNIGGADAGIVIGVAATNWTLGIDNNQADKFMIVNDDSLSNNGLFTITTAGGVGIGTTSPVVESLLEVAGNITSDDGSSGGYCLRFRDTDDAGYTYVTYLNGVQTVSQTVC